MINDIDRMTESKPIKTSEPAHTFFGGDLLKNKTVYLWSTLFIIGVFVGGYFVFDKIYMTFSQRCLFADIRNEVVKEYPDIKGPQAAVIRAAILSRLMRKI